MMSSHVRTINDDIRVHDAVVRRPADMADAGVENRPQKVNQALGITKQKIRRNGGLACGDVGF